MAHYLPVLLVSVNTNAVPDDSALVTLPRGQVDYLSHEWQEEDVWRSWRNMTRQKNAIANGARLENASWRTWWKQRNKLKTVSPETLNWLKDSDVTWLYGPLHTAVEWTPPPKPQPVPDSVDAVNPASAHDRLDLSSTSNPSFLNIASARRAEARPAKPILKHRSIGELLTGGDYQPSSVYSPMESEDDEDDDNSPHSPNSHIDKHSGKPMRPSLTHTKSDTHIIRWGGSRAFRKDSPPRIDPPGFDAQNANYFPPQDPTSSLAPSTSSSLQPFSSHPGSSAAPGAIRSSVSQDSTSTSSGGHEKPEKQKKKHISFNTFVEQCIAIEKPKKNASGYFGAIGPAEYSSLYGATSSASFNSVGNHNDDGAWIAGEEAYVDDDGYDEDQEEEDEDLVFKRRNSAAWESEMGIGAAMGVRTIRDDSDEFPVDEGLEDVEEAVEEEEDDDGEDDEAIQIRSRRGSSSSTLRPTVFKTPKKISRSARSQSKVSTSSSSSATSTSSAASGSSQSHGTTPGTSTSTSPNSSLSPSRKPRKNSAASTVSAGSGLTATPSDPSTSTNVPSETSRKRVPSSSYRPSALPPGYIPSYHAHRPPLIRTPSEHVHVTIAPIAPTLLKTTGAWSEGFGDDASDDGGVGGLYGWAGGALDKANSDRSRSGSSSRSGSRSGSGSGERDSNRQSGRNHGRGNGFQSPTADLDPARDLGIPTNGGGYIANPNHGEESTRRGRRWDPDPEDDDSAQVSDGTPVELVYVPPLGSNYSFGMNGVHQGGGPYADGIYNVNDGYFQCHEGEVEEGKEEEEELPEGVRNEDDDDEGSADAVYHHPPLSSSPGLGTTAPIPIASVTEYPPIPEVVNAGIRRSQSSQNFAAPTSAPKASSFMQQRPTPGMVLGTNSSSINAISSNNTNLEEEDENDFFGGPDLGEDYYYARRGGRGYDRGTNESPLPKSSISPNLASGENGYVPGYVSQGYGYAGTGYAAQMQKERERENAQRQREREKRDRASDARSKPIIRTSSFGGGLERRSSRSGREGRDRRDEPAGEERQGRSRSRSQSRTPSPAMLSSSSQATPIALGSRKRSSSASSSANPSTWMSAGSPDLLSPPRTGSLRQSASSSLLSSGRVSQPVHPTERQGRGRSSTRTPSSSLSPDGITARSGSTVAIGAVLAGSGRVERESEDDRRGRERRGRDRTSGKVLSASETERAPSDSSKDGSSTGGSVVGAPAAGNMDASFYSTTSSGSSASNASTIVGPTPSSASPPPPADAAQQNVIVADIAEQNKQNELRYLRRAEEDQMRRAHPTPSNSPIIEMRHMTPSGVGHPNGVVVKDSEALPPAIVSSGPSTTTSYNNSTLPPPIPASLSSPKLRPPPIVPTTGSPVKPSTSFISSPRRSASLGPHADGTFQALASIAVPSPSGNVNPSSASDSASDCKESTIVDKAVDIMSSAGAFLGLWVREKEKVVDSAR